MKNKNPITKGPITKGLVVDWQEAREKADQLEDKITDRLDYVIQTIFDAFGVILYTWYFGDAAQGELGSLTWDEPEIFMVWDASSHEEFIILDRDGNELIMEGSVPTRWLFQSFEEELRDGKRKYEEQESARLAKVLSVKEATKKLAASAKKKLTKEELAAIKKTL